jgi:hypothetical protein
VFVYYFTGFFTFYCFKISTTVASCTGREKKRGKLTHANPEKEKKCWKILEAVANWKNKTQRFQKTRELGRFISSSSGQRKQYALLVHVSQFNQLGV